MDRLLVRDEREVSVDCAADRLAYVVLPFGLLMVIAYRRSVSISSSTPGCSPRCTTGRVRSCFDRTRLRTHPDWVCGLPAPGHRSRLAADAPAGQAGP